MEINWTPQAVESLIETVRFIRMNLGDEVAYRIRVLIEKRVEKLSACPELGKIDDEFSSEFLKIRFIIVNKRSKVFYFIHGQVIHVVLVWDSRQSIQLLAKLLRR